MFGDTTFTNIVTGEGSGAITYTSGTPATATVNSTTGEVIILAKGSTIITATKAETAMHAKTTATYTVNITAAEITTIDPITGKAQVGQKLTVGTVEPTGATVTYQWRIAGTSGGSFTDIVGATNKTYTPVASDLDKFIKVVAIGTGNYSGTATSEATTAVATPQ